MRGPGLPDSRRRETEDSAGPCPQPQGLCSTRGRASFLGKTSWMVQSGLRIPPSATLWGLGEAQGLLGSLAPAGLSGVLANLLQTRWGPCCVPALPSVLLAAGVRTGHPGPVPAFVSCPGCTCPPPPLLINPFRPLWEAGPTMSMGALTPNLSRESLMPSCTLAHVRCPFIETQRLAGLPMNQGPSFGCGPFPALPTCPTFSSQNVRD